MKAGLRHAVERNWQELEAELLLTWPALRLEDVAVADRDAVQLVSAIHARTGRSAQDVERRLAGVVERIQRRH